MKTTKYIAHKLKTQQTDITTTKVGRSYAQAAKTNIPTEHAPTIDSTAIKARQILMDKTH